jgi:hypothetical protein
LLEYSRPSLPAEALHQEPYERIPWPGLFGRTTSPRLPSAIEKPDSTWGPLWSCSMYSCRLNMNRRLSSLKSNRLFRIYYSIVAPRQYFLALISESWCNLGFLCSAARGVSLEGASGMRDAEISNFGVRPRRRSRPKLPGALTMGPLAHRLPQQEGGRSWRADADPHGVGRGLLLKGG